MDLFDLPPGSKRDFIHQEQSGICPTVNLFSCELAGLIQMQSTVCCFSHEQRGCNA
jgi:hypothetical protein